MKRTITLLAITMAVLNFANAQVDCSGGRFSNYDMFSGADVTSAVTFGNNDAVGGGPVDLNMDVYEPTGDVATGRPVVVLGFGGSFISGSRADVEFLCTIFAKLGYVAVAPDYRTGLFLPNQVTTTLAVMRAAHDMKACVRYLRKTVAEDGNPYNIDQNRIIVGGISAGAIAAVHEAYLDDDSEIPAYMTNDTAGLGGVEGNSGTPGYSSVPLAVLSFSGTIGDSSWINAGDVPICSVHEEDDGTVPYGTQEISVSGIPTGLIASGSRDIHARAENVGIDNCLLTYRGVANHVGYLFPVDQEALDFATAFCANMVCDGTSDCHSVDAGQVGISEADGMKGLKVYPNPSDRWLNFSTPDAGLVTIIDNAGREVLRTDCTKGMNRLDVSNLTAGPYLIRTETGRTSTSLFMKQ